MNGADENLDELRADIAKLRHEMRLGFAKAAAAAVKRHSDFMRWTMRFWVASLVTYVGALITLAKVLK